MKKLMVSLLIVAMLASLFSVGVLADYTITVEGTSDAEYNVYKAFDITETTGGIAMKPTAEWEDFLDYDGVDNYIVSVDNGYISLKDGVPDNDATAAALTVLAKAYAEYKGLTPIATVNGGSSIDVAGNGYYLLLHTEDGNSALVKVFGENVTVVNKNPVGGAEGLPKVEKEVEEDSTDAWGYSNTADIGQLINFQTTITANVGATNYKLTDTMQAGMTFNALTDITLNGVAVGAANYTFAPTASGFTLTFTQDFLNTLVDEDKIVVSYTAYLNGNAVAGDYTNTTTMTHTATNITATIVNGVTTTTTEKFELTKTGAGSVALPGAGFTLTCGGNTMNLVEAGNGTYKICAGNGCGDPAHTHVTEAITNAEGKIVFVGLDADSYTLEETTVPAGYIKAANKDISVPTDKAATIENILADPLPETGGMGTTMFYVLGGILAVSAAAVLFARKRREEV